MLPDNGAKIACRGAAAGACSAGRNGGVTGAACPFAEARGFCEGAVLRSMVCSNSGGNEGAETGGNAGPEPATATRNASAGFFYGAPGLPALGIGLGFAPLAAVFGSSLFR